MVVVEGAVFFMESVVVSIVSGSGSTESARGLLCFEVEVGSVAGSLFIEVVVSAEWVRPSSLFIVRRRCRPYPWFAASSQCVDCVHWMCKMECIGYTLDWIGCARMSAFRI